MRTRTKKKKRTGFILVICLLLAVFLAAFLLLAKKYAPSRKVLPLTEFYSVEDGEILVVMQDQVMEERGKLIGDRIYLKYEQITDVLNKRFYWDRNENLLIYTTASSVIKAEPGRKTYQINKNSKEADYDIVSLDGDNVYIALDFVRLYTDLSYQVYEEPQRVVITYRYGEELLYTVSKRKTQIRKKAGIKSDVLATVPAGSRLACLDKDGEEINGFIHVITEDGVTGYISSRKAEKPYSTVLESKNGFQEESYSHIRKDGKINMAWHQVFNQDANNQLSSLLEHTEGITTISPTWFRITGENGDITSIASESYVEKAHSMGIEVWALVSDVDEKVDMGNILSYTEKREKIEKELLSQAIRYDIDGINIDFETISKDCAASYLQFIRELSIRCRKNDIVLSIDTYVPTEYSAYYDNTM